MPAPPIGVASQPGGDPARYGGRTATRHAPTRWGGRPPLKSTFGTLTSPYPKQWAREEDLQKGPSGPSQIARAPLPSFAELQSSAIPSNVGSTWTADDVNRVLAALYQNKQPLRPGGNMRIPTPVGIISKQMQLQKPLTNLSGWGNLNPWRAM